MSTPSLPSYSLSMAASSVQQASSAPQSVTPSPPVSMVQAPGSGHNQPMIKLTTFQGKDGEFLGWSKKLLIRSTLLNYVDILEGKRNQIKATRLRVICNYMDTMICYWPALIV